jgi:hypothetical protein
MNVLPGLHLKKFLVMPGIASVLRGLSCTGKASKLRLFFEALSC